MFDTIIVLELYYAHLNDILHFGHCNEPFFTTFAQFGHSYRLSFDASFTILIMAAAPTMPMIKAIRLSVELGIITCLSSRFFKITGKSS